MAIYHVNLKAFGRSQGHSSVAAAAYRAGVRLKDDRTGIVHNFANRRGVVTAHVLAPAGAPAWASRPAELWNRVETTEVRRNACVAQELEVSLPHELAAPQRQALADALGQLLVDRYRVAVLVAVHEPTGEGDGRNHHVHLQFTTRALTADGFGAKVRVLQDKKTGPQEVRELRAAVADLINAHLAAAGMQVTVDHRSLETQARHAAARGDVAAVATLSRLPQCHEGKAATALARRGAPSDRRAANRVTRRDNTLLAVKAHRHGAVHPRSAIPVRWRSGVPVAGRHSTSGLSMVKADTSAYRRTRLSSAMPVRRYRVTVPLGETFVQMLQRLVAEFQQAIRHAIRMCRWNAREAEALRRRLAHDRQLRRLVWRAYAADMAVADLERMARARAAEAKHALAEPAQTETGSQEPTDASTETEPDGLRMPDESQRAETVTEMAHPPLRENEVGALVEDATHVVATVVLQDEPARPNPIDIPLLPASPSNPSISTAESNAGPDAQNPAPHVAAVTVPASESTNVAVPVEPATRAPSRREWAQRRRAQQKAAEATAAVVDANPQDGDLAQQAQRARAAADLAVAELHRHMATPLVQADASPAIQEVPAHVTTAAVPQVPRRGPGRR
jgi:hypothetical protein